MATINKPGVYIQETLAPNIPSATIAGPSTAVFVGFTDRGPTNPVTTVVNSVPTTKETGVPTVVNSFNEFNSIFGFGSVIGAFDPALKNGPLSSVATASEDMKYAVKSFFDNGGGQAIIVREVNTNASTAYSVLSDNSGYVGVSSSQNNLLVSVNPTVIKVCKTAIAVGGTSASFEDVYDLYPGMAVTVNAGSGTIPTSTVISAIDYTTGVVTLSNPVAGNTVTALTFTGSNTLYVRSETGLPFKDARPGATTTVTSYGVTNLTSSAASALLPQDNGSKEFVISNVVAGGAGLVLAYNNSTASAFTNLPIDTGYVTFYGGSVTAASSFSSNVSGNVATLSLTTTGSAATGATTVTVAGPQTLTVGSGVSGNKIPLGTTVVGTSPSGGNTIITLSKAITGTISSGSTIEVQGAADIFGSPSTPAIKIKAKGAGAWSNNIWVAVTPNATPNYFDLKVYYSLRSDVLTAQGSQALLDSELVEAFSGLSLDPAETQRYAPSAVVSDWVTVSVPSRTETSLNSTGSTPITVGKRLPAFTKTWTSNASATSNGLFSWNSSYTTFGTFDPNYTNEIAFNLGDAGYKNIYSVAPPGSTTVNSGLGAEGATQALSTDMLDTLNLVTSPLVINFPAYTDATRINNVLNWTAARGDSFVVIDPVENSTVLDQLYTISNYNSNPSYGAVYYPYINVDDPSSTSSNNTVAIPPGGAVAAVIVSTDSSYGAYKSPAGVTRSLYGAVPTKALTQSEFDSVSSSRYNINVIRSVPNSGTCIMGARTIFSTKQDVFISVRRSLNFLESSLKQSTEFALFEPNSQTLWNEITGIVSGILDSFWREGGLAGAEAAEAYYVKCDSTINTPATIGAGQLNIEVGVALQRPAEFVIIKIGQLNGGTTVTTSI